MSVSYTITCTHTCRNLVRRGDGEGEEVVEVKL